MKSAGVFFCDGSARQIVDMLLEECAAGNVDGLGRGDLQCQSPQTACSALPLVAAAHAPALVSGYGGLFRSRSKMGATGFAYDLARKFGLKVVEPCPRWVPFTLGPDDVRCLLRSRASRQMSSRGPGRQHSAVEVRSSRIADCPGPPSFRSHPIGGTRDPVEIDFLPDLPDGWLRALKRDNAPCLTLAPGPVRPPSRPAGTGSGRPDGRHR